MFSLAGGSESGPAGTASRAVSAPDCTSTVGGSIAASTPARNASRASERALRS